MTNELDNCPFCDHEVTIVSNRDWHRVGGQHSSDCPIDGMDGCVVPATPETRVWLVSAWNNRAAPAVANAAPERHTDLSKRLRAASTTFATALLQSDILAAADEIDRYYTGMLNWKATAEAKDAAAIAALPKPVVAMTDMNDWNVQMACAKAMLGITDGELECIGEKLLDTYIADVKRVAAALAAHAGQGAKT